MALSFGSSHLAAGGSADSASVEGAVVTKAESLDWKTHTVSWEAGRAFRAHWAFLINPLTRTDFYRHVPNDLGTSH